MSDEVPIIEEEPPVVVTPDPPSPYVWPILPYIEYANDGRIIQIGNAATGFLADWLAEGRNIALVSEVPDHTVLTTHRIDNSGALPSLVPRDANPSRVEGSSIVDIPVGSTVFVNASTLTVNDGVLELSSDIPGEQIVRIDSGTQYAVSVLRVQT